MELTDGTESVTAKGNSDDKSDDAIVSYNFSKAKAIHRTGNLKTMSSILLQVVLKEDEEAQSFAFFRI